MATSPIAHPHDQVITFADENVADELKLFLFDATFFYVQVASPLKENEVRELAQTLPEPLEQRAKSSYFEVLERGISQGVELGLRKMLISIFKIHPEWTDQQIATFFDVPLVLVTTVRKEQEQSNANPNHIPQTRPNKTGDIFAFVGCFSYNF